MNPAIGVDLGTTNTVIGVQDDAIGPRLLPVRQPADVRGVLESRDCIKSAVLFEARSSAVVGAFAAARLDSVKSIKSKMGTRWRLKHPFCEGVTLTPAYVSGHILKAAHQEILHSYPGWDRSAIVTVPAAFNTDQRSDTLLAADMAGFRDVRLLDEPTAAFYYYFDKDRDSLLHGEPQCMLVFDFGGGTLDVSIIRVRPEGGRVCLDTIGRSRYNNLGGDDIDLDLAAFMLACYEYESKSRLRDMPTVLRQRLIKRLVDAAMRYKEEAEDYIANGLDLNDFVFHEAITDALTEVDVSLTRSVSREIYDEVTGRYFENKSDLNIFRPIGQAIEVAQMIDPTFTKETLSLILYTGGASRMAGVRAALHAYFGPPQKCFSLSDEDACNTVALGAASRRYDQLFREDQVCMTDRLLESVLTRDDEGVSYVELVPLKCEPSDQFKEVSHEFHTRRDLVRLRLPLFRGVGSTDHHLTPLRDLAIGLDRVVEAGTAYSLSYRMTRNKTVELRVTFQGATDGVIGFTADAAIDLSAAGPSEGRDRPQLCTVNEAKGREV